MLINFDNRYILFARPISRLSKSEWISCTNLSDRVKPIYNITHGWSLSHYIKIYIMMKLWLLEHMEIFGTKETYRKRNKFKNKLWASESKRNIKLNHKQATLSNNTLSKIKLIVEHSVLLTSIWDISLPWFLLLQIKTSVNTEIVL